MEARLEKIARSIEKIIIQICEKTGIVSVVFLFLMVLLTVADVLLRYFLNRSLAAAWEFSEYTMLVVVFLALAWCALKGKHVNVDILVNLFPTKAQEILTIINHLLIISVSVLIGVQAVKTSAIVQKVGDASQITKIPLYPFYYIVAFGAFLLTLAMLLLLVRSVLKVTRR